MTPAELRQILDRLGYSQSQAAEAVGCDRTTVSRVLSGAMPLSGPVWHSLRRHEMLVRLGAEEPVRKRKAGRPPKAA